MLRDIINLVQSKRTSLRRCLGSVELLMKDSCNTFVKVECASSLIPELLRIVQDHYLAHLDDYGNNVFSWFSLAAFLTPKYWVKATDSPINDMLMVPRNCFKRAEDFYRSDRVDRKKMLPLTLAPTHSCNYTLPNLYLDTYDTLLDAMYFTNNASHSELGEYLKNTAPTQTRDDDSVVFHVLYQEISRTEDKVSFKLPP